MELVTLTIDGNSVEVKKGQTVLDAIRKLGVYVPALCHFPGLNPVESCKLCIVKIDGWDKYPTSCSTVAEDGMVVTTNTPELQEMRRNALETMLAMTKHPVECLFCDKKDECPSLDKCLKGFSLRFGCKSCPKDGECEIQKAVAYTGLKAVRYETVQRDLPILSEPFFDRNYNLCILCSRCVRTCSEVRGENIIVPQVEYHQNHIIGPVNATYLLDANCKFCAACVDACPTGALTARFEKLEKPEKYVQTTCLYCGVGCQLEIGISNGKIVRIRGKEGDTVNNGQLCVKGRFGLLFADSPERLKKPLIRKNGELVESTWKEAIEIVTEKFSQYKGENIALLSSAKCTNEENYLMQKFARVVMKTNNIDHCARLCHASTVAALAAAFGSGAMTNSIEEIGKAKCIFVIGSNTTEQHPVAALKIKQAKKNGAKLIVADPRKIDLTAIADIWMRQKPGTDVALVLGICKVILDQNLLDENFIRERCEGFEDFKESLSQVSLEDVSIITGVDESVLRKAAIMYAKSGSSSIIYAMGITQHSHGVDNILALANLAMMTGNVGKPSTGINPLRGHNNVQGACDMGALPPVLPGYQNVLVPAIRDKFEEAWGCKLPSNTGLTVVEMVNAAYDGEIKAMYVMGENPMLSDPDLNHARKALKNLDFLVVQDIFLSETAQLADVVLPAACGLEKDGTFTSTERKVQRVRKVLEPPGEAKQDWEIICEIAAKMGYASSFTYTDPSEIMDEIAKLTPSYGGINFERLESGGLAWPCPDTSHPGTPYLHKDKFVRGKGKFTVIEYKPSKELPDELYPFILTTGRSLYHFHTGTLTRRVRGLEQIRNRELLEINPLDAKILRINEGDVVEVSSRRGRVKVEAKPSDKVPRGVVFMTFHFKETPTNVLTNPALDPVAKIPELKVCAVAVKRITE
ncbi:MAG: formate dehydrogenase subunit alpha [Deltaproteobacteria bacterium]|nr:MAG: formate dehydrogenase subunit alpha [Deltaproteobacteria bacterium]